MEVSELIALLQEYPSDMDVWAYTSMSDKSPVEGVTEKDGVLYID